MKGLQTWDICRLRSRIKTRDAEIYAPDAELRPSAHALHAAAPELAEYLPEGQLEQAVDPVELEKLPAGHLLHFVAPESAEYSPSAHLVQEPLTPDIPALQ